MIHMLLNADNLPYTLRTKLSYRRVVKPDKVSKQNPLDHTQIEIVTAALYCECDITVHAAVLAQR